MLKEIIIGIVFAVLLLSVFALCVICLQSDKLDWYRKELEDKEQEKFCKKYKEN